MIRPVLPEQFFFDSPFNAVWRDEAQSNLLREACLNELRLAYGNDAPAQVCTGTITEQQDSDAADGGQPYTE